MNIALFRLMAGFRRFKEKYFLADDAESSAYHRLASQGQTPKTLMIGCCDSRVDPAVLTGASPGELFVVRNVANLVPPCETSFNSFHGTSSALEFAVMNLKVENIIILGHRQCGGIRALMQEPLNHEPANYISKWMHIAYEAKQKVLEKSYASDEEMFKAAEMESIKVSLKNLLTFPFVKEAVDNGTLHLIGIYFDLEQGELWELDHKSNQFAQLKI